MTKLGVEPATPPNTEFAMIISPSGPMRLKAKVTRSSLEKIVTSIWPSLFTSGKKSTTWKGSPRSIFASSRLFDGGSPHGVGASGGIGLIGGLNTGIGAGAGVGAHGSMGPSQITWLGTRTSLSRYLRGHAN
eukprot:scaffold2220_cov377-Prasinococcus_capsulatus_cf.AAC.8